MFNEIVSRRELMKLSAAGVLGFSASNWLDILAARAQEARTPTKNCILLWMAGGMGAPVNRRIGWNDPLVAVRGGAYFFLPSHAALKFLASDRLIAAVQTNTVNYPDSAER